jgi:ATP-dependent DNA helicase RecQ
MFNGLLDAWQDETGNAELPVSACIDFLYESLIQRRRDEQLGDGVVLSTVHSAKGTEYDHVVLCGDWSNGTRESEREEERRVFYVGMTRARHSLCVIDRADTRNPFRRELAGPCFAPRRETVTGDGDGIGRDYELLGLDDIFMDLAGQHAPTHAIHRRLSRLKPGATVSLAPCGKNIQMRDGDGVPIGQLSARGAAQWRDRLDQVEAVKVIGMYTRLREDITDKGFLNKIRCDTWEIPICEIAYRPASATLTCATSSCPS